MAKAVQKIKLSPSRDIPFNKLALAQSNVRRTKAGVSIEDLAEDIARRSLLQSLNVRPITDAEGQETGMFEVPAGGRRYRALELLVQQKRLAKTSQNALNYSMNHERNIGRDSIDESMEEEIFSTEMRLHDREKFLLGKINKQITRLAAGEIDVCEDCGESISFRRLLARPVTTLCA